MERSSQLRIDRGRVVGNVRHWRALLGREAARSGSGWERPAALGAVVKADAYGLGADAVLPVLAGAGVRHFCVYSVRQAIEAGASLERVGAAGVVLALQSAGLDEREDRPALVRALRRGWLHVGVDSLDQLVAAEALAAEARVTVAVHLHLDTGMARGGMQPDTFLVAADRAGRSPWLRIAGIHTHFATAREDVGFMDEQSALLDATLARAPWLSREGVLLHAASTLPTRRHGRFHRTMVRVGLGLYGYGTEAADEDGAIASGAGESEGFLTRPEEAPPLRPVLEWRSSVIHLQRCPAGSTVGYSRSYRLARDSLIALVPAGYADGYPLSLSNQGVADLLDPQGRVVGTGAVVGRVSMDQITLDVTELGRERPEWVRVGLGVRLYSPEPASPCALAPLATAAQSSVYEMLCRLSHRLPRVWLDGVAAAAGDGRVGAVEACGAGARDGTEAQLVGEVFESAPLRVRPVVARGLEGQGADR